MKVAFGVSAIIFVISFLVAIVAGGINIFGNGYLEKPEAQSIKPFVDFIEVIDVFDIWVMVISAIATFFTWIAKKNSPF
jgi:hypothetical protein